MTTKFFSIHVLVKLQNSKPNIIFFYRSGTQTPQQIFLINLSVAEAIINFLQLLTNHSPPVVLNSSDSYSNTTGVQLIDAQSNTTVLPMNSTLLSRTGEWKYRELENRIYGTGKVYFLSKQFVRSSRLKFGLNVFQIERRTLNLNIIMIEQTKISI